MIVATEWRTIGWDECPPSLKRAYESGHEFGAQMRSMGNWIARSNLAQFMKNIPIELRLTPGFFFNRGLHDGLADKESNDVGTILAAHFPRLEEEDRIISKDVGDFLSTKFPGKSE